MPKQQIADWRLARDGGLRPARPRASLQRESREREVASISYELKQAAMKHDCLVLLLSQLTVDERTGSAHLRESRALGQDANCILFIEGQGEDRHVRVGAARSAPSGIEIPLLREEQFTKFSECQP